MSDQAPQDAISTTVNLEDFDTFMLDIDGVIWNCDIPVPGSVDCINTLVRQGKQVIFYTNNTDHSPEWYAQRWLDWGIETPAENVITPAWGIANYISTKYPDIKKVYLIGTDNIRNQLTKQGIQSIHRKDLENTNFKDMNDFGKVEIDPEVGAVVLAYDWTFDYVAATHGLVYLTRTNKLITASDAPVARLGKYKAPVDGAFLAYFQKAHYVEPEIIGKPSPFMAEIAIEKFGINRDRCLIIGDTLKSELKMAQTLGIQSALVLSGLNQREDLPNNPVQPTYVLERLSSLLD